MVGRGRGRGGTGNQGQQEELAKLRCMIEDLSRVVFTLQRQEPMGEEENNNGYHTVMSNHVGSNRQAGAGRYRSRQPGRVRMH